MSIRIVTDSTSDLPDDIVAKYGITVIPTYVNIGDESYLDRVELSRREFYDKLPDYASPLRTSAPGIGTFIDTYERLAAEGAAEVLSIHLSAALSSFYSIARSAAQAVTSVKVSVFDSTQLTLGTGLLALVAAKAVEAGRSMLEILEMVKERAPRVHTFAALNTLEYLRRSGRLTGLQFGLGSALRIKPLLRLHNGQLVMEKVRTYKRTLARLDEIVNGLAPLEELALVHTNAVEKAEALWERFRHLVPHITAPLLAEATPAIGVHVGPGAVGLVCVRARR
jgi:DegV family protein with EDD domain